MRHPDSDIIERPAQRNMGPDTETRSKEHGTRHRDLLTCDHTQRPTQRNMGPDTETRSKEHGTRHPDSDIIQRPAKEHGTRHRDPTQRNMGPDTETHSKEHGTRHRDLLKGTWDEASRQ